MKKILILGAAESGVGAAVLAQKQGFEVFVSDNGKIKDEYRKVLLTRTYLLRKVRTMKLKNR